MFIKKFWIFLFLIGTFSSLNATFEHDMQEDEKDFPMKSSASSASYSTHNSQGFITRFFSLKDKNPDILKKNDTEESISDTMHTVLALVIK